MKEIILAKIKDLVEDFYYHDRLHDEDLSHEQLHQALSYDATLIEAIANQVCESILACSKRDAYVMYAMRKNSPYNSPDRKDTIREEFAQERKRLEERILKQLNAKEIKTPSPELVSRFKVLFARENEIREEYEEKRRALEGMVQPIRDHVAECELFWNNHFGEDATVVVFVFNDEGAKKGIKVHRPNLDRGRVIIGGSLPHGIEYEETILCLEDED